MQSLKVTVHRAIDLPIGDIFTSDPYVILSINAAKFKTKVIKKNLNPIWEETTTLPVSNPFSDLLKIVVMDWDRLSRDDVLGSTIVHLNELDQGKPVTKWLKLNKGKGQICVTLTALGFGQNHQPQISVIPSMPYLSQPMMNPQFPIPQQYSIMSGMVPQQQSMMQTSQTQFAYLPMQQTQQFSPMPMQYPSIPQQYPQQTQQYGSMQQMPMQQYPQQTQQTQQYGSMQPHAPSVSLLSMPQQPQLYTMPQHPSAPQQTTFGQKNPPNLLQQPSAFPQSFYPSQPPSQQYPPIPGYPQ